MTTLTLKSAKKVSIAVVILIISIFIVDCRNAQIRVDSFPTPALQKSIEARKWISTGYSDIELGKSTRDDVVKKFGKPLAEGEEELEGEEEDVQKEIKIHSGKLIMLYYENVGEPKSTLNIYIGEHDNIVRAIVLYPNEDISKESITSKYGEDFIELGLSEPICLATETMREKHLKKKDEILSKIVYPQIGMYVSLYEKGQEVNHIGFLLTCQE